MNTSNFIAPGFNAASMGATITGDAVQVYHVYGWSAQFVFTGSPVGTLKVQVSDDPYLPIAGSAPVPTNWTDLADSSQAISAAGDITYNVNLAFYNWIRFIYTRTSGTGTITGRVNLKGN